MLIRSEWVSYGEHSGYLAWPERAVLPLPALLVIQEVWGVSAHIEDVANRLAAAGYAALAPDLYARHGERPAAWSRERVAEAQAFVNTRPSMNWTDPNVRQVEIARLPETQRRRVDETMEALFASLAAGPVQGEQHAKALLAATRFLRRACPATLGQKVASVGFCMGGGLSALLACYDPDLAGAVIFYGSSPPAELALRIRCPVRGFYGSLDQRINATVTPFAETMKAAGTPFESQIYQGAMHGFFNDTRPAYDVRAARDSFARLLEFLRQVLA
jgi:carboxymethylenebutenolidase